MLRSRENPWTGCVDLTGIATPFQQARGSQLARAQEARNRRVKPPACALMGTAIPPPHRHNSLLRNCCSTRFRCVRTHRDDRPFPHIQAKLVTPSWSSPRLSAALPPSSLPAQVPLSDNRQPAQDAPGPRKGLPPCHVNYGCSRL